MTAFLDLPLQNPKESRVPFLLSAINWYRNFHYLAAHKISDKVVDIWEVLDKRQLDIECEYGHKKNALQ